MTPYRYTLTDIRTWVADRDFFGRAYTFTAASQRRLDEYFGGIGSILRCLDSKESFALYARGLFGDSNRKSVKSIAASVCDKPARCRVVRDRLLHFIGVSPWSDLGVRRFAADYALAELAKHEHVEGWIVDDTDFPYQGNKAPGVQRQYGGMLGKTGKCQLAVSITVATRTRYLPIDMDLYLPASWAEDRKRCRAAHIPDDVLYRPKWRIALDLIERNVQAGVPIGLMLGDSAYGDVGEFRDGVRALGFDYALDVEKHTRVVMIGENGAETEPMSVETVSAVIGENGYQKVTWREGSWLAMSAAFARVRVCIVTGKDTRGEEQWLVIEKPERRRPVEHYVLTTLPRTAAVKQIVRRIKQRWQSGDACDALKKELGLDHFEGHAYTGWQHHVSCVLACYAFIVAEHARRPNHVSCVLACYAFIVAEHARWPNGRVKSRFIVAEHARWPNGRVKPRLFAKRHFEDSILSFVRVNRQARRMPWRRRRARLRREERARALAHKVRQ